MYKIYSILLLAFVFNACENDMAKVNQIANKNDINVETIIESETIYSDNGKVKAKLNAPILKVYNTKDPYKELPDGLTLIFYNDSIKENGRLTAKYGISYDLKQKVTVKRNVIVINVKGEKLLTEELHWDVSHHTIRTDKAVTIITNNEKIDGEGMEADEDFSNYKIKKIKGIVKVKNNVL